VYELLTQQYELAKIQEAKEIPTVRVLDVAAVPERKASPQRMTIVAAGTLLAFLIGGIWVIGEARWQAIDARNPQKQLVYEIAGTVSAYVRKIYSHEKSPLKRIGRKMRRVAPEESDETQSHH
jgi:hypothetical protein